ncbi:unnamed protein product [Cylindrotheca closterium]|uniref:Ricin B lectin domain-containing protein n=1 Tax=Cylindrotheca closterium TaxID=2856 RepID=A0AAD2FEM6_9STRA|nr:unnamed protein product [Cylindrotheca closterium]
MRLSTMKYAIVTLLFALQLENICVSGSTGRPTGKKVRGSDHQNRNLVFFQQRKQVPSNYALKAGLKRARLTTTFSVPTTHPSAPSKAKSPTEAEAFTYSLGKNPSSPTPPSVWPPQTPVPSESPSSQPSRSPTRKPTPFPTLLPTPSPTKVPIKVPTDTLSYVGNNGNPSHEFPLAMCEGDCDSDNDCMDNLICRQRDGTESVPGCNGSGNNPGTDFCTDPSLSLTTQSSSGGFMLRLYWQSSYFWQETHAETWWCLECTKCDEFSLGDGPNHGCVVPGNNGGSCREGYTVWIRKCKDTRRHFKWDILKNSGSGDQVRARDSNLCLSTVSNRYVEMKQCDSGSSRQLFMPITDINKFELRPYHQRTWPRSSSKCLSQLHHPKDKELVGLHSCETARNHETIYWEEYHR